MRVYVIMQNQHADRGFGRSVSDKPKCNGDELKKANVFSNLADRSKPRLI